VELTPRTAPGSGSAAGARRRRSPWAYGVLVVVLAGLAVVVYQGLTQASLYFYNADEAVAQRADLGDKRFRLQGLVVGQPDPTEEGIAFVVAYDDVEVEVHHEGDPPELFDVGIPVVLEGRWDPSGDFFASDRILVKHSEQYEADNEDRLVDAERGGPSDGSGDRTSP